MKTIQSIKTLASLAVAAITTITAFATDNRDPQTPQFQPQLEGNKVHFHANAVGVQIYRWSGAAWVFVAPRAVLFDNNGNVIGLHYATPNGPAWETSSGSFFVGKRINGVVIDPTAIPWLLLERVSASGPGVLDRTTFVQRANTIGGLAPSTPGAAVGDLVEVNYEAQYFFYRQEN